MVEGAPTVNLSKPDGRSDVFYPGNTGIYGIADSLVAFLSAGKVLKIQANNTACNLSVSARQIATIDGILVDPI